VNDAEVSVVEFIASLKAAVTAVVIATPVEPEIGVTAVTVGGRGAVVKLHV
jgi:hypothetical protein